VDWKIEKSQLRCGGCEAGFEEEADYFSALEDTGTEFVRKDFCPNCWPGQHEAGHFFSFWKARVPRKEEPRRLLVDNSILFQCFLRISDQDQRRHFRYLLALILTRKKVLRFQTIRREGGQEFWVLRYPKEGLTFEVLNPKLTPEELEQTKAELNEILQVNLEAGPPPEPESEVEA